MTTGNKTGQEQAPLLGPLTFLREAANMLLGRLATERSRLIMRREVLLDLLKRTFDPARPEVVRIITCQAHDRSSRKICIFAHYDPDGKIDDYVARYLSALHNLKIDILFVSTAEGLTESEAAKIAPYCRSVIVRDNIGYDFGSWKVGLQYIGDLRNVRTLILANDSVYGPLYDLKAVFASMEEKGVDFWGITDSYELFYHIQSYFLVFSRPVFLSAAFQEFWTNLPFYRIKRALIWRGEVGLTRHLIRAGFKPAALCEYRKMRSENAASYRRAERARRRVNRPVNPTVALWKLLCQSYRCPFMKIEPIRDSATATGDISAWVEVLRENTDYDPDILHMHMKRTVRHPLRKVSA